jgi:hypothetical protein
MGDLTAKSVSSAAWWCLRRDKAAQKWQELHRGRASVKAANTDPCESAASTGSARPCPRLSTGYPNSHHTMC